MVKNILKELKSKNIRINLVNDSELDIKAPKGVMTKEIITVLKENKQGIIDYLSAFKQGDTGIKKAKPSTTGFPLSYAQKKLWVLSQLEERSIAYTVSDVITIPNAVNIDLLKKAIRSTIVRHESLRTVFRKNEQNELRQWIFPEEEIQFKLTYEDIREVENKSEFIEKYLEIDKNVAFDLSGNVLLRTCLFQVEENLFVFYYIMHHIITDAVSMDIMKHDVLEYYTAYLQDEKPNLPELRIQYKDYVVWQYEQMKTKEYLGHKEYWLQKLSGQLPVLDLPNQKPRPRIMTYNGETLYTYIDAETTNKLKEICMQNGGTMFTGVLTVLNILFYKYTQVKDIIIGSPVAGRDLADLENQMGIYMNMMTHRNVLDVSDNFIETLLNVKKSTLESTKHQMYPVDKLMDDLKLNHDTSRNPIYDVMLSFHNASENNNEHLQLTQEELDIIHVEENQGSKLDMLINFKEEGAYMYFDVNYNTDIYTQATIKKLMHDFKKIIKELLKNPQEKIESLDYNVEIKKSIKQKNKTKFKMKMK